MQKELGFPSLRDSFLPPSKPTFLFKTLSLNFSSSSSSSSSSKSHSPFYASAPSTPSTFLFSQHPFFSVPNSTSATRNATFSHKNSSADEIDLETSRGSELETGDHFSSDEFPNEKKEQKNKCRRRHHQSLPAMAFADEAFSDGSKVDEFEFERNRRFEFETGDHFNGDEFQMGRVFDENEKKEQKKKCRRRHHESLPAMAFADEFFSDLSKVDELESETSHCFELETSDRFDGDEYGTSHGLNEIEKKEQKNKYRRRHHESLPAMAFSIEFFSDGSKVDEFESELETADHFNGDEYGTGHGFNENEKKEQQKKCRRRHHESLPAMAFADELFSDGKVMPLNPPPSQLHSSSLSPPPGNPNARFRIPFTRSLWNDDFDPFMVALETVKEEKRPEGGHRRAKSMLPLRACTTFDEEEMHENCLHSSPLIESQSRRRVVEGNGEGGRPIRLTEPKGVMFARRARMVKLGYNYEKPITIPTPEAAIIVNVGENGSERRSKWHKMVSFQMRRVSEEKDQNVEIAKSKLRKLSFRSKKMIEEKKEMQVAKMTLVQHRPKLLLCLGYGAE